MKFILCFVLLRTFSAKETCVRVLGTRVGIEVPITDMQFYLATAKNYPNPSLVDFNNPKDVTDTNGTIYFIIHGWKSSSNASKVRDLTETLVRKYPNAHVVQVNWIKRATDNYDIAASNTENLGNMVNMLVYKLICEYKVSQERIVLIGHSLGGQICGWVGKKFTKITGRKLSRIIALDPAGPLFDFRPDSSRLNKNDAEVVMVIHTDGDKLGFPETCGTIDFFPNGGSKQPGCWAISWTKISSFSKPVTCDHSRAWEFFTEAIKSTGSFAAKKCKSFHDFKRNLCEKIVVSMGDLETKETGEFYLRTKSKKPYYTS